MRTLRFECSPSVEGIVRGLGDRSGRFVLGDVALGTAIVGASPHFVMSARGDLVTFEDSGGTRTVEGDPLETLGQQLEHFRQDHSREPVPFAGGAVGYLSYDLGRLIEVIPSIASEDIVTPDLCLGFYDSALIIDLPKRACTAVSWSDDREALNDWRALAVNAPEARPPERTHPVLSPGEPVEVGGNFTRAGYLAAVERIRDYIAAGDVYQVNLAQRFETELPTSPWDLYASLRRINPAPNSCYLENGLLALASASPELFLLYDPSTRRVVTRPIKGTRPRGKTSEEDARLASELAASHKDRAENLMIVDMERNDLGRVAKYGSVTVPRLFEIETHPNVFQMVSTVEAELDEELGPVDLIRAAFPGGSITGAPKIRAMEIIEELEPHRRGIYTGSAGLIDFRGRMDLNIVIRSFVVSGERVIFHAGGGIVTDSDPEREYQETLDKIAGLRAALSESRRNA